MTTKTATTPPSKKPQPAGPTADQLRRLEICLSTLEHIKETLTYRSHYYKLHTADKLILKMCCQALSLGPDEDE